MPRSSLASIGQDRSREADTLAGQVLDVLGDAVIVTDPSGSIIIWNRAAEQLYGWTSAEAVGRNVLDVTPGRQSRATAAAIMEHLTKGEGWSGVFETAHKSGRAQAVEVIDTPVHDESGALVAIVGVSRPIEGRAPRRRPPGQIQTAVGLLRESLTPDSMRPLLQGFAIVAGLYVAAVGLRFLLDALVPGKLPFLSFFPAVAVAGFMCGLWPTAALVVASALTGAAWAAPTDSAWAVLQFALLFVMAGGAVGAAALYATGLYRQLQRKEEQLVLISRELKHRLKNLFAVTSAIATGTLRSNLPRPELARAISGRISAIASAQDLIAGTAETGADLRALVDAVVKPLAPEPARFAVEGPRVTLPAEATTPLALVLHELATNAIKHGAWAAEHGRLTIGWRLPTEQQLVLDWQEEGGAALTSPQGEGFGSELIARALPHAKVRHAIEPQGARCTIELPI